MKLSAFSRSAVLAGIVAGFSVLYGCSRQERGGGNIGGKPVVVTTTTMVTDLVNFLAEDAVEIQPLMGPGVDPHTFNPGPEATNKLQRAALIIYSGLHLEGRMTETFKNLDKMGRKVVSLGESLPKDLLLKTSDYDYDPHIWGDASLWAKAVPAAAKALMDISPSNREAIQRRAQEFQSRLAATHSWLRTKVQELPAESRVLVTSHDAFRYFGKAYDLKVFGVLGISTDSEASAADMARIIDLVKKNRLKAVFVESSVPRATIERISNDTGARIGGELLSDALAKPGDLFDVGEPNRVDRGTVNGMLRANMATIVRALK